jgi:hypothetical protein
VAAAVAQTSPGSLEGNTAAAAATAGSYSLPAFTADMPLSVVEPGLYGLLDHFGLPDEFCEQLAAALEQLQASAAAAAAAAAAGDELKHQGEVKLGRFAGDYAQLRSWAGRGRVQQVQKALQRLLDHALKE